MKWVNFNSIKPGDSVYGLDQEGRFYFAPSGMKIKEINEKHAIVRHYHGDLEIVSPTTKFYVKEEVRSPR